MTTTNVKPLEMTLKVILIAIPLTIILAAANTYLALKIGVLTSASIPAAILAMVFLRCFKTYSVLENNLIQTAASAGEAVAGGIVYTIPALVILHYWHGFNYWQNVFIALISGWLGVLFSIPLRPILLSQQQLLFPEGRAIASVIQLVAKQQSGVKPMLRGLGLGVLFEFLQAGLQLLSSGFQRSFILGKSYLSLGFGFNITMIGAGFLMGFRVGLSILIGAALNFIILMPIMSHYAITSGTVSLSDATDFAAHTMKFVGLGAMLMSGLITLLGLLRPLYQGLKIGVTVLEGGKTTSDIPISSVIIVVLFLAVLIAFFTPGILPMLTAMPVVYQLLFYAAIAAVVIVLGFIAAAICGYFSGLVGVSASPGSAIILGSILLVGVIIRIVFHAFDVALAMALVVLITSFVTGIACIVNDNIQDLKVGQILGATPRYQQYMMFLGVFIASLIIPWVMQILFQSYGIADVLPRAQMSAQHSLAAPPAAMLATMTQAFFAHDLPYRPLFIGMGMIVVLFFANFLLPMQKRYSLLSVAMGMYLSLPISTALFLGSLLARWVTRHESGVGSLQHEHPSMLFACGLVCGSALLDVGLAFVTAQFGDQALQLHWKMATSGQILLTAVAIGCIYIVMKKRD